MIQNKEIREGIKSILETVGEGLEKIYFSISERNYRNTRVLIDNMIQVLSDLAVLAAPYKEKEGVRVADQCICMIDSLNRIRRCFFFNPDQACEKLLYETIPFLEYGLLHYEYWGCAYPDKEEIEKFKEKLKSFYLNESIRAAVEEGADYRYDVSILVTAYNHLDYTKACVESILQYLPENYSCELVLFNHGSSDGTKAYFESICPTKQIDMKINRAIPLMIYGAYEGKYMISISNDIMVTPNALENMCRTIVNDEKIGWIVPTTSNVSNYQAPQIMYENMDEMLEYASKNNVYDENRHEERARLCNPVTVAKMEVINQLVRELYVDLCGIKDGLAFPDDKYSLWLRRNGYKLILAKDAYCHHGGSITLKDEITPENQTELYIEGRRKFSEQYGIDPWGKGCCFSAELEKEINIKPDTEINILGINCGVGSNPLKIREMHKENNIKGTVYNITDHKYYHLDQRGVSDHAFLVKNVEEFIEREDIPHFDYIVIEDDLGKRKEEMLPILLPICNKGAQIFIWDEQKESQGKKHYQLDGVKAEYLKEWVKVVVL